MRVAQRHRRGQLGESLDQLVVSRLRDEHAGLEAADLPVVAEGPHPQRLDRRVEVGVVQDDRSGLPAELERDAAQVVPAQLGDAPPGRGRSREGHLVDAGVGHQVLADLAVRGHNVDHPRRQTGLVEQLGEQVSVQRGSPARA